MKILAIIGSGELGQQIAHHAVSDGHYEKIVFFDDFSKEAYTKHYQILGNTGDILKEFDNKSFDEIIIAIGYKHLKIREEIFNQFEGKIPFGTIIHSSSFVDSTALIGDGVIIYPRCIIDANVVIKHNSILNIGCSIAHDTIVGEHCFLSPNVALAGFVNIGIKCNIGINACFIDNVNIVANVQIGAGTVVTKNIEKEGLYVGNPHRFIR